MMTDAKANERCPISGGAAREKPIFAMIRLMEKTQ
jgi:hypothetical protein